MSIYTPYRKLVAAAAAAAVLILSACATTPQISIPSELVAPTPVEGNSGKYLCPYTSDDVLAEWVDKAVNAKMGAAVGGAVGARAGQELAENIPFIGGFLGQKIGETAGREIAVKASGGWDYIRATSDISFDNLDDMAVYMYVNYSQHAHFQDALSSVQEIYPELKTSYYQALVNASRQ